VALTKPVTVSITRPPTVPAPVVITTVPTVVSSPTRNYTVKATTRQEMINEALALAKAEGFDTITIFTENLPPT
jgi:hypothetical protein